MQFPERICEGTAFKVHCLSLSVIFVQFHLHKYRVGISAGKKALQLLPVFLLTTCLFTIVSPFFFYPEVQWKKKNYSSTSLIQHLFEEQKRAFQILLTFLCFPFWFLHYCTFKSSIKAATFLHWVPGASPHCFDVSLICDESETELVGRRRDRHSQMTQASAFHHTSWDGGFTARWWWQHLVVFCHLKGSAALTLFRRDFLQVKNIATWQQPLKS